MSTSSKAKPKPRRMSVGRSAIDRTVSFPYVILGAGCSGLSLAWNLVELGVREPILLVDRRESFANDRTWCFWDVEPTPFSDLATHAWPRWRVHDGKADVVSECPEYPYLRLRAGDVFRKILERLALAPNVSLALGLPILEVRAGPRGVTVATPERKYLGGRVFDSSGMASQPSPAGRGARLLQHFLGQTLKTNRPVFDPSCPTLMDFRASQSDGPHFVYVLPLSETEALVENTYLYPFAIDAERHRREIAEYLWDRHGLAREDYEVIEEEAGAIPMAVGHATSTPNSRIERIGLPAGAARPSSGYAFLRIQRQTRQIAEAIVSGRDVPTNPIHPLKYNVLDAIFLKVLADRPEMAPRIFGRMFEGSDPASLVRFLSEKSTPIDDARIVAALPKWPFITAAVRSAWEYRPMPSGRCQITMT